MAKLILETVYKGNRNYHQIHSFPATVGRALDNDVIVSDITVSPNHLHIDETETGFKITNLSTENGTKVNQVKIANEPIDLEVPSRLQLGDLKVTAMLPDTEVAPTRIKKVQRGFFSFLNNPFWALTFVAMSFGLTVLGKFITTPVAEGAWVYVSKVLPALLFVFLIALIITCVSRLSTHRWAIVPAISIAALFMLLPQIFDHVGRFLDYYLTSSLPTSIFENMRNFLLVPVLLVVYMVRVHYVKISSALGIAFLATMPISAFFLSDLVDQMSNNQGFSPMPSYNKSLSSLDIRAKSTMSIDDFIGQASSQLDESMIQSVKESSK
jgi:hypothetical protein